MSATAVTENDQEFKAQHLKALEYANQIRIARANLKRQISAGECDITEVVLDCPTEAETMTIADLLVSQRRWGRSRVRKLLMSLQLSETKTLISLTERQRAQIVETLNSL